MGRLSANKKKQPEGCFVLFGGGGVETTNSQTHVYQGLCYNLQSHNHRNTPRIFS
jgi:hypothetical protein